jgi:hypothetical protein
MANGNYYKNDKTETEPKKSDQLTFNLIGAELTLVEYVIDKRSAEKALMDLASDALNDGNPQNNVESAKFVLLRGRADDYVYDEKGKRSATKPHVSAQIIIPSRNGNLIAKDSGNDFIRSEDTTHYSAAFKQFVHDYCNEDNKSVYITKPKRDRGISYRAIIVDISKFFGVIFDYNGQAYKRSRGENTPIEYVDLKVKPIYDYNDGRRASELIAFKVTKAFQSTGRDKNLVFDVYDTGKKKRYNDDDYNRDNGKRNHEDPFEKKDFRRDYKKD